MILLNHRVVNGVGGGGLWPLSMTESRERDRQLRPNNPHNQGNQRQGDACWLSLLFVPSQEVIIHCILYERPRHRGVQLWLLFTLIVWRRSVMMHHVPLLPLYSLNSYDLNLINADAICNKRSRGHVELASDICWSTWGWWSVHVIVCFLFKRIAFVRVCSSSDSYDTWVWWWEVYDLPVGGLHINRIIWQSAGLHQWIISILALKRGFGMDGFV